jgi:hypothetical protein
MRHGMHRGLTVAAALMLTVAASASAQDDASQAVANGGIFVDGWRGVIDAREAANGMTLKDARFEARGQDLHVRTGPATTYWNTAARLSGNYTVKATFTEHEYQALNNHPHPYGIVIGLQDGDAGQPRYLYCSAYGNGNFIMRGFGPEPFQLNGARPQAHDAVNRAAGRMQPVTQEIAIAVRDGRVECIINGTVVATFDRGDVVQSGRLSTTDGYYGLRFGHNTEATVKGLAVTRERP